jgi:hypothetical protein
MSSDATILFTQNETTISLNDVLRELNANMIKMKRELVLTVELGRKYIRVVENLSYGGRSVYCFFDYKGNIYKAASWKAPAKGIRGTLFDDGYSWGKALGPYGAAYLKYYLR